MKTGREAGGSEFCFLEVNDGSTFSNLQVCWLLKAVPCAQQCPQWRQYTHSLTVARAHQPM